MEPKAEDKPVTETKPAPAAGVDKDDRGVDWKNRAMEYERKYRDMESRVVAEKAAGESARMALPEEKQKRLAEFVEDPEGYLDRHYQQRKFNEELPQAEQWLSTQPHFSSWDDAKTVIRDHNIDFSSPLRAVRTVNELLKARALEREFAERKREDTVTKSSGEGSGRTAPVEKKETRRDLIKQLAAAQRSGNTNETFRLLNKLEDVRD